MKLTKTQVDYLVCGLILLRKHLDQQIIESAKGQKIVLIQTEEQFQETAGYFLQLKDVNKLILDLSEHLDKDEETLLLIDHTKKTLVDLDGQLNALGEALKARGQD